MTNDLRMRTNLSYQFHNDEEESIRNSIKHHDGFHLETDGLPINPNNRLQNQAERVGQSDKIHVNEKGNTNYSPINVKKYLYIMVLMIVILLMITFAAIALSIVTYTQKSKWLDVINSDIISLQTQLDEAQTKIPQAIIQFNSTENGIIALQTKLDERNEHISSFTPV